VGFDGKWDWIPESASGCDVGVGVGRGRELSGVWPG
jgi:hypothetical protein